jgi:hypothetical protein
MFGVESEVCPLRTLTVDIPYSPPVCERGEEGTGILVEAVVEVVADKVESQEGGCGEEPVGG